MRVAFIFFAAAALQQDLTKKAADFPIVLAQDLPKEARDTLALIKKGGPYPYSKDGVVFSNRCWPILRLTGEPPTLDAEAWRHWFCLGWFPDLSTPVRNVRVLDSGEIIVGDSRAVTSTSAGALSRWIQ